MRFFLAIIFLFLSVMSSRAGGQQEAAAWWASLSLDQRVEIQTGLILTGDYQAFVDGEFGPATYRALQQYLKHAGRASEGILSDIMIERLRGEAATIFDGMGMELIHDEKSGLEVFLPLAILTEKNADEDGSTYSNEDGGLAFYPMSFASSEGSLAGLSDALLEPDAGKVVTYHSLRKDLLVISGTWGDHSFYSLFKDDGAGGSIGFNVNWTERYEHVGRLSAMFAASYFGPSEPGDSPGAAPSRERDVSPTTPSLEASAGEQIGAFLLPDTDPTLIILNRDIEGGTALEFRRAIKSRPMARTLLLNSGGGSVNEALLVAHQIADIGIETIVPEGGGCYSACAYVFFAGRTRVVAGELGVHQIYGNGVDVSGAQAVLSDVLDALAEFGVPQEVISVMLRTPPDQMHIFTPSEIALLSINRSGKGNLADGAAP